MKFARTLCLVGCCATVACIPTTEELVDYGLFAFLEPCLYVGLGTFPVVLVVAMAILRRRQPPPSWAYCVFAATLAAVAAGIIALVGSAVVMVAAVFVYDAIA